MNIHMKTILKWCENSGLQIAKDKTEITLLTRMRVPKNFNITLTGEMLNTCERVKYLGVVLDSERKFSNHIEAACTTADAIIGVIGRLLPNLNRPSDACSKLYYRVWDLSKVKTAGEH